MIFLLLIAIQIVGGHGRYHYVLAPNVIRFENEETLVVGVLGDVRRQQISVWLEYLDMAFSKSTVIVPDAEHPLAVSIKVTEHDLFSDKPSSVRLICDGPYGKQTRDIILSYESGYVIVQTDKPLYNPREPVYVRVLAMDEGMNPIKHNRLEIDLINPLNRTVDRVTLEPGKKNGIYRWKFEFPSVVDFGTWTIIARIGGMFETWGVFSIEVREFVLPTFGVTITPSRTYILPSDDTILVVVTSEYVYGKEVEGTVGLDVGVRKTGNISEPDRGRSVTMARQQLKNGKASFVVELDKLNSDQEVFAFENAVLVLTSTVVESATGKEESSSDHSVTFVKYPFKFDLSRSRTTYRSGVPYFLQVDMLHPNGTPAKRYDFILEVYNGGQLASNTSHTTNKKGQCVYLIAPVFEEMDRMLKLYVRGFEEFAIEFQLKHDSRKKPLIVEQFQEGDASLKVTNTDFRQVHRMSGIIILVLSRGKIVEKIYSNAQKSVVRRLDETVLRKTFPRGRVIAFYVDNRTNEVFVDSSTFNVDLACNGQWLELIPERLIVQPGSVSKLTVNHHIGMLIGLNVIDKALLLLNKENILKVDKIKQGMESHDLGCGAGDGETSEDIFTNAGLTILTNANINATRIIEETKECADKKRARHYVYKTRDSYGGIRRYVPSNDDQQLLDDIGSCGYVSLKKVRDNFNTTVLFDEITPRETCFETKLSHSDSITTWTVQAIGVSPSNEACLIETRNEVKAFKEFFIQVNVPYKVTRNITFHVHVTVFNYLQKEMKVRVYLKTANTLCYGISNEETFQPQLIHMSQNSATTLALPFVPLEYGTYPIIVSAFASNEHTSISDIVRKEVVVSDARPMTFTVDHSNILNICLDTDEEPRCQSSPDGVLRAHSNMGETPTVSIYFEIPLPENYIPGTNKAIAHIKEYKSEQRIWCLINGIGETFRQPKGFTEATMILFSAIAYGLDFLKNTDTLDIQQMEQWTGYLRQGIDLMVNNRKDDGSYSTWKHMPSSLWLTAFVAKVFCNSYKVVKDVGYTETITLTLSYMAKENRYGGGSFQDYHRLFYFASLQGALGMQSDPKNDPSLTSFVLISFQECKIWNEEITNSSRRAMAYLEQLSEKTLRGNPFLLAITAYALALANSDRMDFFRDLLYDTRSEESDLLFWSNHGDAPNSYGVETTAYALLTFLEVKEYRICTKIAAWLSKQETLIKNVTFTMQNAIPLQALAKYTERVYRMNEFLEVRIENGPLVWSGLLSSINDHVAEIDLPLTNESNRFQVTATRFGSGTLTIEMSYKTKPKDETITVLNSYNISNIIIKDALILKYQNESKCDVCGYCEEPSQNEDRLDGEKRPDIQISARLKCVQFAVKTNSGHNYTGLSVVKTYLPVGVNIVPSDIQKMFNEGVFVRYEMPNDGKGFVQFYMDKISTDPSVFIFRIEDTFSDDFSSRFVLSVLVYDYYNPERSSMKHYMIGSGNGQASPVVCDDVGGQCKCNRVLSSDSEEIFQEPTPADALYDHTHDGECHVTGCYCHSVTGDQTCRTLLKKKPTSKDGE